MTVALGYGGGRPIQFVVGEVQKEKGKAEDELRDLAKSTSAQFSKG